MELHEIADDVSDLDLLSAALKDAVDARREGVIVGPPVDEMALVRAARRARRRDAARALRATEDGAA